ncbi:MAG: hypothetical protein AAF633_11170, partial [Chloroflexota bacterium]
GDSWGSPTTINVRDNLILFESNGISTNSRGNIEGVWNIANNTLVMRTRESGGGNAILLNNQDRDGVANIDCNLIYGAKDAPTVDIDGSVEVNSDSNVHTGRLNNADAIESEYVDLGFSMSDARDLSGINVLEEPAGSGTCRQGASFASVEEHYRLISSANRALGDFRFPVLPPLETYLPGIWQQQ